MAETMEQNNAIEKLERDGKVAVLYSPGFGAGWYTWNLKHDGLLFDREIAERVLANDLPGAAAVAERKYAGVYLGGGRDLRIKWVPKGSRFLIDEYDGNESITVINPETGHLA